MEGGGSCKSGEEKIARMVGRRQGEAEGRQKKRRSGEEWGKKGKEGLYEGAKGERVRRGRRRVGERETERLPGRNRRGGGS